MSTLQLLITTAGWLHFLQIPAIAAAPRVLSWDQDFALLKPINRQLVKVIFAFIVVTVVGLGAVVVSAPAEMVGGGRLGAALCLFLALFWTARACVQAFVLGQTFPRHTRLARSSHRVLVSLFSVLAVAYGAAFVGTIARGTIPSGAAPARPAVVGLDLAGVRAGRDAHDPPKNPPHVR